MPELERQAAETRDDGIAAMDASEPNIEVTRQYSPDLMALVTRLSQVLGYYSADGHYARTMPVTNIFEYERDSQLMVDTPGSNELNPIYNDPELQYDFYEDPRPTFPNPFSPFGFQRCPGTASQPAEDGSTPFNEGFTAPDDCDPNAVIPEQSATSP
jgi:phospholipid/cholesterol/gamma-HCH transport system substrate-binding protein